jgi:uncharacterized membrane protein HdeD (DUF308 family)
MRENVRLLARNKIVFSVLSIVLGVVFIVARREALDVIIKIVGVLLTVSGLALLLTWVFRRDAVENNPKLTVPVALMTIMIGVLVFFLAPTIRDMFPTIMGVILILNGMSHVAAAFLSPYSRFFAVLMGIITIVLGFLIVMHPGSMADAIMIYIGAFFILNGLFDLSVIWKLNSAIQGQGGGQDQN